MSIPCSPHGVADCRQCLHDHIADLQAEVERLKGLVEAVESSECPRCGIAPTTEGKSLQQEEIEQLRRHVGYAWGCADRRAVDELHALQERDEANRQLAAVVEWLDTYRLVMGYKQLHDLADILRGNLTPSSKEREWSKCGWCEHTEVEHGSPPEACRSAPCLCPKYQPSYQFPGLADIPAAEIDGEAAQARYIGAVRKAEEARELAEKLAEDIERLREMAHEFFESGTLVTKEQLNEFCAIGPSALREEEK